MASASNYGVVALVTPPTLRLVDQPSLINFETEYAAYKNKFEDVNKDRTDATKLHLATIKDCMESATHHALCVMREIVNADKVEDATLEAVKSWFNTTSSLAPKDLSERIDSALQSVNFEANHEDPAGGITYFIVHVITALDQNNASEVLSDQDLAKNFIDLSIRKLKDPVLQERIKMRRRRWNKHQLSDIKIFKNEVASLAVDLALTETARQHVKPQQARNSQANRSRKKDERKPEGGVKKSNEGRRTNNKRKDSEWTDSCLNPECDETHRLKDCLNTTAERKKELFDEHYKNKKLKKAKAFS